MFYDYKNLKRTLFLDIETVSGFKNFDELPDNMAALWKYKTRQFFKDPSEDIGPDEWYVSKAGIFAEFAKVVCISVGYFLFDGNEISKFKVKSFASDDESVVLTDFVNLLKTYYSDPKTSFICGHNIKEFDIPFLCRRMVINGIEFPTLLDISGKKPWETAHLLDTMDMWRFGDYKNYTSLNLLSATLGIPSPKDDIDGSMVGHVYWQENDLERISLYCQKDVVTVAQVLLKFAGLPLIDNEKIELL